MLDQYAVIGNPISHSQSPRIHSLFAQQTDQSIQYSALFAPLESFATTVFEFIEKGGRGANVTLPFKLQAHQLATRLTERATCAQAVNTLSFENGEIIGDNTDGIGLVNDITYNLSVYLAAKHILLIGAGGAARGVILPLLQQNPSSLTITNRTFDKAKALQQQFQSYGNIIAHPLDNFSNRSFDIVINATSTSLHNTFPAISTDVFEQNTLAYDMMYSKESTAFLKFAQQAGANRLSDGIGMLVEQAAESFYIWRNVRPKTKSVIAILRAQ
ncbi:MAG: shikimate dehydrogenase [Nitrosomonas sp.]